MIFIIKFLVFVLITFLACEVYERRRKNEHLILTLYFAIVAVVFLL